MLFFCVLSAEKPARAAGPTRSTSYRNLVPIHWARQTVTNPHVSADKSHWRKVQPTPVALPHVGTLFELGLDSMFTTNGRGGKFDSMLLLNRNACVIVERIANVDKQLGKLSRGIFVENGFDWRVGLGYLSRVANAST